MYILGKRTLRELFQYDPTVLSGCPFLKEPVPICSRLFLLHTRNKRNKSLGLGFVLFQISDTQVLLVQTNTIITKESALTTASHCAFSSNFCRKKFPGLTKSVCIFWYNFVGYNLQKLCGKTYRFIK